MKIRNSGEATEKIEVPMTPMIDIVFQLLVFFIMTFKIVDVEGDFNIKMPLSGTSQGSIDELVPPMRVRLRADPATGELASASLNQESLPLGTTDRTRFQSLNEKIVTLVGDDTGPSSIRETAEVEIDADYALHYKYVVQAITAVSGYVDPNSDSRSIVKLIEKIKFSPPKAAPGG